eukprot:gene10483-11613_t
MSTGGCCCLNVINTSEVGVVEKYGKFSHLAEAGCFCLCAPFEYVVGKVSLRVQELKVSLETKTKDNVFVDVHVSVQYQTIKEKVYAAFYMLSDSQAQMKAYIYDSIRASLCQMTLDESFESKEEISMQLKAHLQEIMSTYGISIIQALVTDLSPNQKVRDAMNEINASKRMKESAYQRAEGEKILKVKKAEAEAESMYLSGLGVARQRKAIMEGLKDSIVDFSSNVHGTTAKDIMDLLVLNQYFDTLQEMGASNVRCVFLNSDTNDGTRNAFLQAEAAKHGLGPNDQLRECA